MTKLSLIQIALLTFCSSFVLAADPQTAPATSQPQSAATQPNHVGLKDLPANLLQALQESDRNAQKQASEAREALAQFLQAEVEERYRDSYNGLLAGVKERFMLDETNQAIVNDINLYRNPPPDPAPHQRDAIDRVKALVAAGKLSLDIDEPSLWAYQWSHSTGSVEGHFETTGPYTNDFRLKEYTIVDVHLASDDLAAAWVSEEVEMPIDILVKRLSVFLLKPEDKTWKIYAHRGVDGPRIYKWLGLKTHLWPDQLEFQVQNPGEVE